MTYATYNFVLASKFFMCFNCPILPSKYYLPEGCSFLKKCQIEGGYSLNLLVLYEISNLFKVTTVLAAT